MKKYMTLLACCVTLFSCAEGSKGKNQEEIFAEAGEKLQNSSSLQYVVETTFTTRTGESKTLSTVYKLQKVSYEPYLGLFFYKETDGQTKIYHKLVTLTVVEDHKKRVTLFDFEKDRSVPKYLEAYTKDEDNLYQVAKLLVKHKDSREYIKTERLNGRDTYQYRTGTSVIWLDSETAVPVKLVLHAETDGEGRVVKGGISRIYRDVVFNEELPESVFTAEIDPSYVTKVMAAKAEPLLNTKAPAWTLEDVRGGNVHLSDYRGRYLFVEAWVSSCDHCVESLPKVKRIAQEYSNKLDVVTVNFDYDRDETENAIEEHNINYRVLLGNAEFDKNYDIRSFPSFYIIDPSGKIIYTGRGTIAGENERKLFAAIEGLKQ